VAEDLRGGALVDAGAGGWRVPVDIRLYRQLAHMAPVAEALWGLVRDGSAQADRGG
jgi:LysR family transcriptional regulator, hypochlorite-specific transcription factor HypT